MLTIGEFARLGQVTVKALRHYDALGLLKPAAIDPQSGYRRYTEVQIPRLQRIGELKALGFRLEAIGSLLDEPPPPARWRALLHGRQGELLREIRASQSALARVDRAVRALDDAVAPQDYTVELVELEPALVAGIRDRIPTGTIYTLFQELRGWLEEQGAGAAEPLLTLAHLSGPYQADTHDAEAAVLLDTHLPASGRVQVRELPATLAAQVVHHGDYRQMYRAHEALTEWINGNGYERRSPGREIYWRNQAHALTADDFLTEIVVPVCRRASAAAQEDTSTILRSIQLPGLTVYLQALEDGARPQDLLPSYLPEGLVVTSIGWRFYGAADREGRIALVWSWIPSSASHISMLWEQSAGEPSEPEAYPDRDRMRYYFSGGEGPPATLILVGRDGYFLLTSPTLGRDELLRIAASFPPFGTERCRRRARTRATSSWRRSSSLRRLFR
jgi:DNA-binding transcriptional MerR regulator